MPGWNSLESVRILIQLMMPLGRTLAWTLLSRSSAVDERIEAPEVKLIGFPRNEMRDWSSLRQTDYPGLHLREDLVMMRGLNNPIRDGVVASFYL